MACGYYNNECIQAMGSIISFSMPCPNFEGTIALLSSITNDSKGKIIIGFRILGISISIFLESSFTKKHVSAYDLTFLFPLLLLLFFSFLSTTTPLASFHRHCCLALLLPSAFLLDPPSIGGIVFFITLYFGLY